MKNRLLLLFLAIAQLVQAQYTNNLAQASTTVYQQTAAFEENKGQVWDTNNEPASYVQYHLQSKGLDLFMLPTGLAYQFTKVHDPKKSTARTETYRMDLELVNANPNPTIVAASKSECYTQYYNRNVLNVHGFQQLTYQDIYPGIDWVIYTTEQGLKYDFVVDAGADPHQIQLRFKHHEGLDIQTDGSLTISNRMGQVTEQAPVSYQGKTAIATQFQLQGDVVSFQLDQHDPSKKLVIDPTLIWATYYGGISSDYAWACATDQQGNVYIAGETNSSSTIASGGHQVTFVNRYDAYLAKFNSRGVRQWGTYYGGLGYEEGHACATDVQGNVYLVGETTSANNMAFNGHQNTYGGVNDAYLVKFNSNGVRQWGTYYGGVNNEEGQGCATDAQGNVYVAGMSMSANNIAFNGHQNTLGGRGDAFLVKFNSNGVRQWGTYYGGTASDLGYGCTVDGQGYVYMTGMAISTNNIAFNGHQNTSGGSNDAFLVKFNSNGVRQWGTYYAGSDADWGYACKTDAQNNVYMAGTTRSPNNIASGGHQNTFGGISDAYLVKFNSSGVRQWGTYYGGSAYEESLDCDLDGQGNIYISGTTASSNNIALGGHQMTYGGGIFDGYLVKFDTSGVRQWGTYYGGIGSDRVLACATDGQGNVYGAGVASSNSNIASGGHQNTYGGSSDAFLAKFRGEPCKASASNLTRTSCGAFSYHGNTYVTSGIYKDTFINVVGCDSIVTLNLTVHTVNTATTLVGNTLTASATGASYQWLACHQNNAPIAGATTPSFTPAANGSYAVAVTQNGCTDTSSCTSVILTHVSTPNAPAIVVYPNPSKGTYTLDLGQHPEAIATLYSIDGRLLQQQVLRGAGRHALRVEGPAGLYLLQLQTEHEVEQIRLVKE